MDMRESEALGDWFTAVTEGVVLPLLTGFVALGAVCIAGLMLVGDGVAFGFRYAYNRYRERRA